jgi:hypothetical protein
MVSAIMQGGCVCENAPGLRLGTNNVDIASLAAPRPMIIISGPQDWTKNVAKEEYPAIKHIYELYGRPENVANAVVDAPHNYNQESREHVYKFLDQHVFATNNPSSLREKEEIEVERLQDMLVLQGRHLPEGALDYAGLFASWREWSQKATAGQKDAALIRRGLGLTLHAEWPEQVDAEQTPSGLMLTRKGGGDRVPAVLFAGQGRAVLLLHPGGSEAAQATPTFRDLRKNGRPVLVIDAFQSGHAVAPRDRSAKYFLSFNVTEDAARVQDVLTALAYLRARMKAPVELIGLDKSSIWALFAATLAPSDVVLSPNIAPFPANDDDFIRDFFVPGIQKAGGIGAAIQVIRSNATLSASRP